MTASGETAPRWEVDEDGWLSWNKGLQMLASWDLEGCEDANGSLRPDAFAALVADVRAARQHDHCPRDADTLDVICRLLDGWQPRGGAWVRKADTEPASEADWRVLNAAFAHGSGLSGETD